MDKDAKRKLAEEAARRWQERDDKVETMDGLLPIEYGRIVGFFPTFSKPQKKCFSLFTFGK